MPAANCLSILLLAWCLLLPYSYAGIVRRSHECATFTPTLCIFSPDAGVAGECSNCTFPAHRVFTCGLVAAGYYTYSTGVSEGGGGCSTAFLAQTHHLPPPCGARCCRTVHTGSFQPEDPYSSSSNTETEEEEEEHTQGDGGDVHNSTSNFFDSSSSSSSTFGEALIGSSLGSFPPSLGTFLFNRLEVSNYCKSNFIVDVILELHFFSISTQQIDKITLSLSLSLSNTLTHTAAFEPNDSTCRFKEISRGQVMRFLATHNSSFLIIGDSTMRQLTLRMIAMMRGQRRVLDYHIHTHAQYQVCRESDFLRLAANNANNAVLGSMAASHADPLFLRSQVPAFFHMEVGPGQADSSRVLSECSHSPLQINYLQAPTWEAQIEMMERYFSGVPSGHRPVLILSVGVSQSGGRAPQEYLQMLETLQESAFRIIYVGSSDSKVTNVVQRGELGIRNNRMRRWIERHKRNGRNPFSYVDFNAMVSAPGAPQGTHGSKHFACWAEWSEVHFPSSAAGNPAGSAQVSGKIEKIHADVEGSCVDEMNRNLWQVILNGLFDSSGTQALQNEQLDFGGK